MIFQYQNTLICPLSISVQILVLASILIFSQVRGFYSPFMILDLHSNTSSSFSYQASTWSLGTSPDYMACASKPLLRSPYNYGTLFKEYSSLPPHDSVYITISLWFVSGWYPSRDKLIIRLLNAGRSVIQEYDIHPTSYPPWPNSVCGLSWGGDIDDVIINIENSHTDTTLGLQFIITQSQHYSSHSGVRDIKINLSNRTVSSPSYCFHSKYPALFDTLECQCPQNQYKNSSGVCENCFPGCATCFNSSSTSCKSCAPGFSFEGTSCILCDPSCETCNGTSPNQCTTCREGHFLFSNNTCSPSCPTPFSAYNPNNNYYSMCKCASGTYFYFRNTTCRATCPTPAFIPIHETNNYRCDFICPPGFYYYSNGSCLSSCDPDFILVDYGGYRFCNFPCANNRFLYWNNTCSTCKPPLLSVNMTNYLYCKYPCLNHEYLFWDRSCKTRCDFPLQQKLESGKNFCIFPCTITQFLNWNGTCLDICKPPYILFVEANRKFCQLPCPRSTFLFENGSCINSCQPPLKQLLNDTVDTCRRPCQLPNIYYYPDDKTCKSSCPLPYRLNETDLSMSCELPLSAEEKKQVQSISSLNGDANEATQGAVSVGVVASADPGGMSSSMLTKMLQYTRYLNITYSAKLEMMFKTTKLKTGFIPFMPSIYENAKGNFEYTNVPFTFAKFNVHSSFVVNFWDGLISLGIVIFIWINIKIFELTFSKLAKCGLLYRIFWKVRATLQNFAIAQLYNSFCDILMFSAIEIRTNQIGSITNVISLCTSFLLVGFGIIMIYMHLHLLMVYQELRNQTLKNLRNGRASTEQDSDTLENFNKENEGVKILFYNFKDSSFIQQSFFLLLNLRNSMFALLIGFMFDYPVGQVSTITLLTLLSLIYLVAKRPFKSIINLAQQLFGDVMLLIVDVCLIRLVVLDLQGDNEPDTREGTSQIIVICNMVIGFVAPIFALAKGFVAVYMYIKFRNHKEHKEKLKKLNVNQLSRPNRLTSEENKTQNNTFTNNKKILKGSPVTRIILEDSQQTSSNGNDLSVHDIKKPKKVSNDVARNALRLKNDKIKKRKFEIPKSTYYLDPKTPYARATRLLALTDKRTVSQIPNEKNGRDVEVSDLGNTSLNMSSLHLLEADARK